MNPQRVNNFSQSGHPPHEDAAGQYDTDDTSIGPQLQMYQQGNDDEESFGPHLPQKNMGYIIKEGDNYSNNGNIMMRQQQQQQHMMNNPNNNMNMMNNPNNNMNMMNNNFMNQFQQNNSNYNTNQQEQFRMGNQQQSMNHHNDFDNQQAMGLRNKNSYIMSSNMNNSNTYSGNMNKDRGFSSDQYSNSCWPDGYMNENNNFMQQSSFSGQRFGPNSMNTSNNFGGNFNSQNFNNNRPNNSNFGQNRFGGNSPEFHQNDMNMNMNMNQFSRQYHPHHDNVNDVSIKVFNKSTVQKPQQRPLPQMTIIKYNNNAPVNDRSQMRNANQDSYQQHRSNGQQSDFEQNQMRNSVVAQNRGLPSNHGSSFRENQNHNQIQNDSRNQGNFIGRQHQQPVNQGGWSRVSNNGNHQEEVLREHVNNYINQNEVTREYQHQQIQRQQQQQNKFPSNMNNNDKNRGLCQNERLNKFIEEQRRQRSSNNNGSSPLLKNNQKYMGEHPIITHRNQSIDSRRDLIENSHAHMQIQPQQQLLLQQNHNHPNQRFQRQTLTGQVQSQHPGQQYSSGAEDPSYLKNQTPNHFKGNYEAKRTPNSQQQPQSNVDVKMHKSPPQNQEQQLGSIQNSSTKLEHRPAHIQNQDEKSFSTERDKNILNNNLKRKSVESASESNSSGKQKSQNSIQSHLESKKPKLDNKQPPTIMAQNVGGVNPNFLQSPSFVNQSYTSQQNKSFPLQPPVINMENQQQSKTMKTMDSSPAHNADSLTLKENSSNNVGRTSSISVDLVSQPETDSNSPLKLIFPLKLHSILNRAEFSHIIQWCTDGTAWRILNSRELVSKVLPQCLSKCKYESFIRIVNAWGFKRQLDGFSEKHGSYYHQYFVRGKPELVKYMKRINDRDKKSTGESEDTTQEPDDTDIVESRNHDFSNEVRDDRIINLNKASLETNKAKKTSGGDENVKTNLDNEVRENKKFVKTDEIVITGINSMNVRDKNTENVGPKLDSPKEKSSKAKAKTDVRNNSGIQAGSLNSRVDVNKFDTGCNDNVKQEVLSQQKVPSKSTTLTVDERNNSDIQAGSPNRRVDVNKFDSGCNDGVKQEVLSQQDVISKSATLTVDDITVDRNDQECISNLVQINASIVKSMPLLVKQEDDDDDYDDDLEAFDDDKQNFHSNVETANGTEESVTKKDSCHEGGKSPLDVLNALANEKDKHGATPKFINLPEESNAKDSELTEDEKRTRAEQLKAFELSLVNDGTKVKTNGFQETDPRKMLLFPLKLHAMLSRQEFNELIRWNSNGDAWRVYDIKGFATKVIPVYFAQCKYQSFLRMVNAWGFKRINDSKNHGHYMHTKFLRNKPELTMEMKRLPSHRRTLESRMKDNQAELRRLQIMEEERLRLNGQATYHKRTMANMQMHWLNNKMARMQNNSMQSAMNNMPYNTMQQPIGFNQVQRGDNSLGQINNIQMAAVSQNQHEVTIPPMSRGPSMSSNEMQNSNVQMQVMSRESSMSSNQVPNGVRIPSMSRGPSMSSNQMHNNNIQMPAMCMSGSMDPNQVQKGVRIPSMSRGPSMNSNQMYDNNNNNIQMPAMSRSGSMSRGRVQSENVQMPAMSRGWSMGPDQMQSIKQMPAMSRGGSMSGSQMQSNNLQMSMMPGSPMGRSQVQNKSMQMPTMSREPSISFIEGRRGENSGSGMPFVNRNMSGGSNVSRGPSSMPSYNRGTSHTSLGNNSLVGVPNFNRGNSIANVTMPNFTRGNTTGSVEMQQRQFSDASIPSFSRGNSLIESGSIGAPDFSPPAFSRGVSLPQSFERRGGGDGNSN